MIQPHPSEQSMLDELLALAPAARRDRLFEAADVINTLAQLIDDAVALTNRHTGRSLDATAMLVDLADQVGDAGLRARARRARARALAYSGQFSASLDQAQSAVQIADLGDCPVESARAMLASMHALCELGRLDEATRVGEHAREQLVTHGHADLAARADINLGITYHRRDDPKRALSCFERARPLLRHEPMLSGSLENSRGEVLVALNEFERAETSFDTARETFDRIGQTLSVGIAEGNLADLAYRQGRLQRALSWFRRARRRLSGDDLAVHRARLLAEEAETHAVLGQHDTAMALFEQSLPELEASGLALEAARARLGMGQTLIRSDRRAEARTSLAAAALAFEELGHRSRRAEVDLVRADLALHDDHLDDALTLATRALAELHDRPVGAALARLLIGSIALRRGQHELADAEFRAGLYLAREHSIRPLMADLLAMLAQNASHGGRLDEAITLLDESCQLVEGIHSSLHADRVRASFLGARAHVYLQFADQLLARASASDVAAAFHIVECARHRHLLDQVNRVINVDDALDASDPEAQAWQRHRAHLNGLYSQLADAEHKGSDRASIKRWAEAVDREERALRILETQFDAARGVASLHSPAAELNDVQQRLLPHQTLIEYACIDDEILAFVVRPDGCRVLRRMATTNDINQLIADLQFQNARALRPGVSPERLTRLADDANAVLAQLHGLLIAPMRALLADVEQIIIVPAGVLHDVPFHALCDRDGSPLIASHRVHYSASASLLNALHDRGRSAHDTMVVIGAPDEYAPEITQETQAIATLRSPDHTRLLENADATLQNVCAACADASVVHIASHGRFDPERPDASGILLSDRWMTLQDIYSLKLDADLVTLSACESGTAGLERGTELTGLLRAFFAAGTRSVLASLWRVDDKATSSLMCDFYDRMNDADDAPLATIYRDTLLSARDTQKHPALWAPFILVGVGS